MNPHTESLCTYCNELFAAIKEELAKGKKEIDQKEVNIKIEGGEDSTDGIGLHTYFIKSDEYAKIAGSPQPHMADALGMVTLSMDAFNTEEVGLVEHLFNTMSPMLYYLGVNFPFIKPFFDKIEPKMRVEGTKISLDFVLKNVECLQGLLDLGINPAEFASFKLFLGTAFKFGDFFSLNFDQLLEKVFSIHFSVNHSLSNITYLVKAIIPALEKVPIQDKTIRKIIKKAIFYMKAISTLISAKFELKYSPKEAAEFALKSSIVMEIGGKEVLAKQLEQYNTILGVEFWKKCIESLLEQFGLVKSGKVANIDNIKLAFLCPKYRTGLVHEFRFPELSEVIKERFLS